MLMGSFPVVLSFCYEANQLKMNFQRKKSK